VWHGENRELRRVLIFGLGAFLAAVLATDVAAQGPPKPLSKYRVIKYLQGDVSPARVAELAREYGIDFRMTPEVERELRAVGATGALLATLRDLALRAFATQLLIRSNTPGARIYLDQKESGESLDASLLFSIPVAPGKHHIHLSLKDYCDYDQDVELSSGQELEVSVTLQKLETPEFVLERTLTKIPSAKVLSVAFSPDGRWLAAGRADHIVKMWDIPSGSEKLTFSGLPDAVWDLSFRFDGRILASAAGYISFWELLSGREVSRDGSASNPYAIAFSPDGRRLAELSFYGPAIRLMDFQMGSNGLQSVASLVPGTLNPAKSDPILAVTFSPDGRWIASGCMSGRILLWDATSGQQVQALAGYRSVYSPEDSLFSPVRIAFSPDSKLLAGGGQENSVELWEVGSGDHVHALPGHAGSVFAVAFSPDGKWLASGGDDTSIRVWDLATGRGVATLSGHTGRVTALSWSSDGRWLASGSLDTTVKLWRRKD
jgi:WD40 repeat protein